MRLTNSMRDSIVEQEVRNKFHDTILKIESEHVNALNSVINKRCPKIPNDLNIYINKSDDYKIIEISNKDSYQLKVSIDFHAIQRGVYTHNVELKGDIKKTFNKYKKIINSKLEFKKELKQVLYSFTTDAKLLTHIPELKEYFKDADKAKNMAIVPTEQINSVRKMLKVKK